MASSIYSKLMTLFWCLAASALLDKPFPTTVNAEALVPVYQVPWVLEGNVDSLLDQQGSVVVYSIKDPCFFPKGLVMLRPGMLSNG